MRILIHCVFLILLLNGCTFMAQNMPQSMVGTTGNDKADTQPTQGDKVGELALDSPLKLTSTKWQLQRILPPGKEAMIPADGSKYQLEFKEDGGLSFRADCNYGTGRWSYVGKTQIDTSELSLTRRACPPGSLSNQFVPGLLYGTSFQIDGGTLTLSHASNDSLMVFKPAETKYKCNDQDLLVAHYKDSNKGSQLVILNWQGKEISVQRVISGSTTQYQQGNTVFREEGSKAIFERDSQTLNCQLQ